MRLLCELPRCAVNRRGHDAQRLGQIAARRRAHGVAIFAVAGLRQARILLDRTSALAELLAASGVEKAANAVTLKDYPVAHHAPPASAGQGVPRP